MSMLSWALLLDPPDEPPARIPDTPRELLE